MRRTLLLLLVTALAACADGNLTHPLDSLAYEGRAQEPLACLPNLDGVIESHELAPTLNEFASYRVSPELPADSVDGFPVDLFGTVDDAGKRVWDWSAHEPSDRVAELMAVPLGEQWYAAHFPEAHFALPTDAAGRIDGLYSHDEGALALHGFASSEESPAEGKTLMVYEEPILFFPFPFGLGDSWTQVGEVRDGWLRGLSPWSQDDVYEVEVVAAGELRLPDFTFQQVLDVYTQVTIQPKAGSKEGFTQHQHSFVFECFGEVARASSVLVTDPDDDPGADFLTAREIRRLGWF